MAGAEMNTVATEHGDYFMVPSVTEHATEHARVAADPTDGLTAATEQVERMVISATADASGLANSARDVCEIARTLKQEIHVEFNNGMWWVMPDELSGGILHEWRNGAVQVSFVWDWQDTRTGSYQFDDEETSFSRYIIDFQTMLQRNTDTHRTRKVKVVGILR